MSGADIAPGPFWRTVIRSAADLLLLPPVCLSCRSSIQTQGLLRRLFQAGMEFITTPLCTRLGIPLPYDVGEPSLSAAAIAAPPVYDRARAVARYSRTMRDLIHGLKYGDRQEGLALFSRWLAHSSAELLADANLLVPVPLYRSRLWWRRFNQSPLLVQALTRQTGLPTDCFVLKRARCTLSHVGLSPVQRRRNVAGAFRVEAAQGHICQRQEDCDCRRCHHHRRHGRGLRPRSEAQRCRPCRCSGACARRCARIAPGLVACTG